MTSADSILLMINVLTLLGLLYVALVRQAKTESRVEILWAFLLRQGMTSSVIGGLTRRNSPLRVNIPMLDACHDGLVQKLKDWYGPKQQKMETMELFIQMEHTFAIEFSKVCEKTHILPGGCAAAALLLLRPDAYVKYGLDEKGSHA